MNTVPVLAASVSVAGAVMTVVLGALFEVRRGRVRRRAQLRHLAGRYSVPLLHAASALRARLGNVEKGQIKEFRDGTARMVDYARYETVYRIARYLCIVRIMVAEVDFLDFGRRRHNRRLIERISAVSQTLSDRELGRFMILGGEQGAFGDLLIDPDSPADGPPRCLSYPAFRAKMRDDPEFARWFQPLLDDIDAVMKEGTVPARVKAGKPALDELIGFLDKRKVVLPWLEQTT